MRGRSFEGICGKRFGMWLAMFAAFFTAAGGYGADSSPVKPTLKLHNPQADDQDDMCVWVAPKDPAASTIITSDKSGDAIFVYGLDGKLLERVPAPKPGNIDIRQGVKWNGKTEDLVVVNQRKDGFRLLVFRVNHETRKLERLDDNRLMTGPNYGGCLYHSQKTGRLFFICTTEETTAEQHELTTTSTGRVQCRKVRSWQVGKCEGAVADDEAGKLFIAEETKGVWALGAEPNDAAPGELVIRLGEQGLKGDLEGLAIARGKEGDGHLLLSDQGKNRFVAYTRRAPHRFVGEFTVEGAEDTDGIEVITTSLGPKFPQGIFACHTGNSPRPVLIAPWQDVADRIQAAQPAQ